MSMKKSRILSSFVVYSPFSKTAPLQRLLSVKGCKVLNLVCEGGTIVNKRYTNRYLFLSKMVV